MPEAPPTKKLYFYDNHLAWRWKHLVIHGRPNYCCTWICGDLKSTGEIVIGGGDPIISNFQAPLSAEQATMVRNAMTAFNRLEHRIQFTLAGNPDHRHQIAGTLTQYWLADHKFIYQVGQYTHDHWGWVEIQAYFVAGAFAPCEGDVRLFCDFSHTVTCMDDCPAPGTSREWRGWDYGVGRFLSASKTSLSCHDGVAHTLWRNSETHAGPARLWEAPNAITLRWYN